MKETPYPDASVFLKKAGHRYVLSFANLSFVILSFVILICVFFPPPVNAIAYGTVIYARPIGVMTLDPDYVEDVYSEEIIANMLEGLVTYKHNPSQIISCLATHWEDEGGVKWTFRLRKDVHFHNGEPFNAGAVVASYKRKIDAAAGVYKRWETLFPYVKEVRALDDFTVEILLTRPYAPFLAALTEATAFIAAPSTSESPSKPVGTGPFIFGKWEKGKSLVIKKNQHYWGTKVKLSKVIFKLIPNPAARMVQIKNGNADVIKITSSKESAEIVGVKKLVTLSSPTARIHHLAFNTQKPHFKNKAVRKAFCHLINKKAMVKHCFQGLAMPALTPVPPHSFGFNPDIEEYEYDIAKAGKLLKEKGLEKGFICTLYYSSTNIALQRIAASITANAKKVNITVKSVPLPFNELMKHLKQGDHDMLMMGWSSGIDPDIFLYSLFTMTKENHNFARYDNPRLKELLDQARKTTIQTKRSRYIRQVQEIIHTDAPWLPLYHLKYQVIHIRKLKNLQLSHRGSLLFKYAYKEKSQ
ncbi:MAG: hypothetical protein GY757_22250 [bacterium]|nr:hypothetical protein [bacterium]